MREIKYFLVLLLLFTTAACTQPVIMQSPPGYDLSKPEVFKMPGVLEEISGIAFKSGNADTIYAEQDEEGRLFYFHPGDKEIADVKFARRGDYEDIAICNNQVVILRSDGGLITFSFDQMSTKEPGHEQTGLLPGGEYESLYADEKTNTIYVLCKDCSGNKKDKTVSGYTLKINETGELKADTEFSLSEGEIEKMSGIKKIRLKASAMAKNSVTGEWYIISAVNKLLVVTDANWKVKSTYPLVPAAVFTQPEGIAFDNSGNLYIANEGGGIGAGTILKFVYQGK